MDSVHGSGVVQFIARSGGQGECWVAHSTAEFAALMIEQQLDDRQVTELMLDAMLHLLQPGVGVEPCLADVHRWDRAFYQKPLSLDQSGDKHNDAVTFRQLSLALCGDYLASEQTIQQAAISGMCAADRLVGWA